jgi:hypothetical protein
VDKPGRKPGRIVPQPHGGALKQGGTIGPGRPPNELRRLMRVDLEARLHVVRDALDNPDTSERDRLACLEFLAKYGLGTQKEHTGDPDNPLRVKVILSRE